MRLLEKNSAGELGPNHAWTELGWGPSMLSCWLEPRMSAPQALTGRLLAPWLTGATNHNLSPMGGPRSFRAILGMDRVGRRAAFSEAPNLQLPVPVLYSQLPMTVSRTRPCARVAALDVIGSAMQCLPLSPKFQEEQPAPQPDRGTGNANQQGKGAMVAG